MPTTSVICVMRRVPSLKREVWMNRSTADAICARMDADAHVRIGHADHHFQAAQAVARGVGVQRGERAVVTGVHGLQHVQRFLATDLTDDDAVGAHTESVDHQLPDVDGARAFHVGRPGFHARHVGLLQAQFGRVFNGDDALVFRNIAKRRR